MNLSIITKQRQTADITDLNIKQGRSDFQDMLKSEHVYRVLLRYFCDIGKINFPYKISFTIKCPLETDMKKLFESKKKKLQQVLQTQ